jgi:hypothetical protein
MAKDEKCYQSMINNNHVTFLKTSALEAEDSYLHPHNGMKYDKMNAQPYCYKQ